MGYALLARHILANRSLNWLLAANALAVFCLLYTVQFVDFAGIAANYNVARWEADRARPLDVPYLARLGPSAWPALRAVVAADRNSKAGREAATFLRDAAGRLAAPRPRQSWQARPAALRQEVFPK